MLKVGITGSIGTGKSLVSNYFKEKGHKVISADEINHILLKEQEVIKKINLLLFNENNDILDKKKVANLIFSNINMKNKLEAFIHPLIYDKILQQIKESNEKIIFIEVPLLFETNFTDLTNYNIVVYADLETQIKRIVKRDKITKEEALKRINSQMPLKEKLKKADYVINNNDTILKTKQELDNWYVNFMRRL